MLGKRKRNNVVAPKSQQERGNIDSQQNLDNINHDVFRRFFETSFTPLTEASPESSTTGDNEIEDLGDTDFENSEWSGLSDSGESFPEVQVVDYGNSGRKQEDEELDVVYQKAFMSSRPPQQPKKQADPTSLKHSNEDADEALNLKHDLDLQRLLNESHLLEQSKGSSTPGKQRQKAIDLRLQELGSKNSLFDQQNMPMSHRKGIVKHAANKEATRRQQARENGVILEKIVNKKTKPNKRRDRAVDRPAVGRFQSGTLKLSRQDVADIHGSNSAVRKSRGKRR